MKIDNQEALDRLIKEIGQSFYIKYSSLIAETIDAGFRPVDFSASNVTELEAKEKLLETLNYLSSTFRCCYSSLDLADRHITIPYDVFIFVLNALNSARWCDHDEVDPAIEQLELFNLYH